MGIVKGVTSENVGLSQDYFRLRGRLMALETDAEYRDTTEDLAKFRNEAYASFSSGGLSQSQYEDLMTLADKAPTEVKTSAEYTRLKDCHRRMTANSRTMTEEEKAEFREEVSLALQSGGLLASEDKKLLLLLTSIPENPRDTVIEIPRRSPRDVPQRKKAAASREVHTDKYKMLVSDYKGLYKSEAGVDNSGRVRKFFREVEKAYSAGDISLAEYSAFHSAIADTEAFLRDIKLDTGCWQYSEVRNRITDSVTCDEAVTAICKQIGSWAVQRGVAEHKVISAPLDVVLDSFDSYVNAGGLFVAVNPDAAVSREQLLLMRL